MKCSTCGYDYLGKWDRCTRCGNRVTKATQKPSHTKLIEFPTKQRMAEKQEQTKPPLPAWRTELSQRVREIRAKKEGLGEGVMQTPVAPSEREAPAPSFAPAAQGHAQVASVESDKIGSLTRAKFMSRPLNPERGYAGLPQVESTPDKRSNSKLVQDALSRVQRASENARRSSLPRIEPSRPQPANTLVLDREATARVLEEPVLELDVQPITQPAVPPITQPLGQSVSRQVREVRPVAQDRRVTQPLAAAPAPATSVAVAREPLTVEKTVEGAQAVEVRRVQREAERVLQLDEEHCLDYLEAEVERVDRELHERHEVGDRVTVSTHVMINLVDLCVIGVSCAPFLALIKIVNGGFDDAGTRQSAAVICLAVAAFYLTLTQLLGNRTFGMMFTRTKVVNASTLGRPTPLMMLLRTAGYALSFAVALIGFIWVAVDTQRRSWHDRLSGTIIVSDM